MSVYRVYHDEECKSEGPFLTLSRTESHHLTKVRRAREGARVDVMDARGRVIECLLKKTGKQAQLQMIARVLYAEPRPALTLGVALLKGKAVETVIRQAAELGVCGIQPLIAEHSEGKADIKRFDEKKKRWEDIAAEACKQSGNPYMPRIQEPCELRQWAKQTPKKAACFVASLQEGGGYNLKLRKDTKDFRLAIGPEGDFSESEYESLRRAGFEPLSLGPYVQRSETAAVSLVARLQALIE